MGQLTCEICGSSDLIKKDGVFQCQTCGMKYSLEEIRSLLAASGGTPSQSAPPAVVPAPAVPPRDEKAERIEKCLKMARLARSREDWQEANRQYREIEMEDPTNLEASFYVNYGKVKESLSNTNMIDRQSAFRIMQNTIASFPNNYDPARAEELNPVLAEIGGDLLALAGSNYMYNQTKNGYGIVIRSDKMDTVTLFNNLSRELCASCEVIAKKLPPENRKAKRELYRIAIAQTVYVLDNGSLANPAGFRNMLKVYNDEITQSLAEEYASAGVLKFLDPFRVQFGAYKGVPLTWRIVRPLSDNSFYLVCECVVERMPLNASGALKYEGGSLDVWLNGAFKHAAFTTEECPRVECVSLPTLGDVKNNPAITPVCPLIGTNSGVWWWTRTEGDSLMRGHGFADVDPSGVINSRGHYTNDTRIGVRPTLKLVLPALN